jgi:hypothetical protein
MRKITASLALSAFALLSGCSLGNISSLLGVPAATPGLKGAVHGGQQPVTGASIQLYAVGTTGDGSAATPLLTTAVQSDASGNFNITSAYTCPSGATEVYLVATGGNPGLTAGTNNTAITMMAALGQCGSLSPASFIFVNEVTTVGSAAALYPYMTSATNAGSGAGDAAAFASAFSQVASYTNTATGAAPGPSLPSGYYASSTEINTLGNILASCINSAGGVAGDGSACGNLFNLTKSGSVAPTDTLGAMLNILNSTSQNVSALFTLSGAVTPFQPVLTAAPATWALPILPIAATPTLSIAGGTYSSAQFVTISDATPGAVIHYTADGSTPTSSSAVYTGTYTVSSSETLQAIAVASGYATSAAASASYTITGSTSTYGVSGQVILGNGCGASVPAITMTLSFGGTTVQTTTTDSSGNFSFTGVPNDTYTVTPSITGPTSAFYPATQSVTVSGGNSSTSFNANLGYTVSGTVAYSGSKTGQIYLALQPTTCGGGGTEGTSISSAGAYTIHGVPPGSYTLQAFMDNVGYGVLNAANPTGSTGAIVSSANLTSQNVTLADPGTVTVGSAPSLKQVNSFNNGVIVQYKAVTSSNVEQPSSYTLQWSTTSAFTAIAGSQTFHANGTHSNFWLLNNSSNAAQCTSCSTLSDGNTYYFRVYGSSAGTATGPYSTVYGPVTVGAPAGGNAVTGTVSFTGTAAGPLYTGFFDQSTNNFYGEYIPSPSSPQTYSVQVPTGSNYLFVGIVDQNNDGVIDAGDINNTGEGNNISATVISGPTSNENLTLPSASASTTVTTQNYLSTTSGSSSQSYSLNYVVDGLLKQPVAVSLASGPNAITPVDIALCGGPGSNCGHGFQINLNTGATAPTVGDTYTFNVIYSDTTTGTLTASVSAVLSAFATNLSPQTGTSISTTPTFTWTDPANPGNYLYSFSLCCSSNSNIWDIPGDNSNSNGMSSSITSITWGTDPTGGGSTPSLGSLVLGTTYTWQITVQDSNGNTAVTQVPYQP